MQFIVRARLAFSRLARRYRVGRDQGLFQVAALIRSEAREKIRYRPMGQPKPPAPGTSETTLSARKRGGIREINFHVLEFQGTAIIGPRKFRNSNFFNRPVPRVHEVGGTYRGKSRRRSGIWRYPERSYMYVAVKRLQQKGKIASRFAVGLQRSW